MLTQDKHLLVKKGEMLPLMEEFYTIQGEGFHKGTAAYFIRLGGCDVGCVWCDVKDSWDASSHPKLTINDLLAEAKQTPAKIVVITGGEPAMYNLEKLTKVLQNEGYKTHIETSGAYQLTGEWDWVCLSPKKFKKPVDSVMQLADELKVVVFNNSDFKWAEAHAQLVNSKCSLFLQPEWSKEAEMNPKIIEYTKQNPQWRISLQTHKYLDIP